MHIPVIHLFSSIPWHGTRTPTDRHSTVHRKEEYLVHCASQCSTISVVVHISYHVCVYISSDIVLRHSSDAILGYQDGGGMQREASSR